MPSWITKFIAIAAAVAPCAVVLAKPEQIRGVSSPIFHYYLQAYRQDPKIPVMGPEASSEYFNIASGAIQSANSSAYLTVGQDSTSYKTLTLSAGTAAAALGWALEGDTIITGTSSAWGRQLNFLVCKIGSGDYWQVYLQTGSEVPSGKTCSNYQSLHLPCLC
ncbi:hypothetical protein F5B22DRAFT_528456 [Xylaria bambusicola]|uniref:uncharacterized protein n=1 Tax=Xylaria bambusicola TaxID=326684 RepID=UPI002007B753|nr:uncharacterized protein F5B22DRAFT_528456 [Xylaria bambusicola]KAI0505335.1 hypothetical protein F5B22DRAFT_528456 [Xylaria bambusicola]